MSNSGPLSQPEKQPKADKPAEVDEDDDMSLPPLDADEEAETSAEEEDLDDLVPGEETDSLDDADATDLDVGAELDQDDDDDENGADATEGGIDIGALDDEIDATDEEESAVDRDEERSASIDDDGIRYGLTTHALIASTIAIAPAMVRTQSMTVRHGCGTPMRSSGFLTADCARDSARAATP